MSNYPDSLGRSTASFKAMTTASAEAEQAQQDVETIDQLKRIIGKLMLNAAASLNYAPTEHHRFYTSPKTEDELNRDIEAVLEAVDEALFSRARQQQLEGGIGR